MAMELKAPSGCPPIILKKVKRFNFLPQIGFLGDVLLFDFTLARDRNPPETLRGPRLMHPSTTLISSDSGAAAQQRSGNKTLQESRFAN